MSGAIPPAYFPDVAMPISKETDIHDETNSRFLEFFWKGLKSHRTFFRKGLLAIFTLLESPAAYLATFRDNLSVAF